MQCAMHMIDGLITGTRDADRNLMSISDTLEAWNKGCVELYLELGQYAALCQQLYDDGYSIEIGAPGVYDYEVCYEFGAWFGSHMMEYGLPDRAACEAKLRELATQFWKQMEA